MDKFQNDSPSKNVTKALREKKTIKTEILYFFREMLEKHNDISKKSNISNEEKTFLGKFQELVASDAQVPLLDACDELDTKLLGKISNKDIATLSHEDKHWYMYALNNIQNQIKRNQKHYKTAKLNQKLLSTYKNLA